jgi:hypothetical protein
MFFCLAHLILKLKTVKYLDKKKSSFWHARASTDKQGQPELKISMFLYNTGRKTEQKIRVLSSITLFLFEI